MKSAPKAKHMLNQRIQTMQPNEVQKQIIKDQSLIDEVFQAKSFLQMSK